MARFTFTCALAALAVAATASTLVPVNTTTPLVASPPVLLKAGPTMGAAANLFPETQAAVNFGASSGPTRSLYLTTPNNANNLTNNYFPFISCDPSSYNGNIGAVDLLRTVKSKNTGLAILYSTTSTYCNLTLDSGDDLYYFTVFTMTDSAVSNTLLAQLQNMSPNIIPLASVQSNTTNSNPNTNNQNGNPLGPSPSTAVAMIILYSITGIITALFLAIIVTGAVRAHRHPERYGPRSMPGRPRQSRAKGIARAMLDTLPIVKFGDREPPKPTDVELGQTQPSGTEATRDGVTEARTEGQETPPATETRATDAPANTPAAAAARPSTEGIAPALDAAGTTVEGTDNGISCSICTDEFEKGQDIRVLPCDHKFHPACIDPWLLNVSGTCPLCRIDLRPATSETDEGRRSGEGEPEVAGEEHETGDLASRRRSMLRDILILRRHPASSEERSAALARLREAQAAGDAEAGESGGRRHRLAARFRESLGIRTRQNTTIPEEQENEASAETLNATRAPESALAERRADARMRDAWS